MYRGAKSSRAWLNRHVNDQYVRQAREQGFQSRAAFKLKELQSRHRLVRPGMIVVECGAAPGGWTQVACSAAHSPRKGLVVAVDLLPLDPPVPDALFIQQDFTAPETQALIRAALERFHLRKGGLPIVAGGAFRPVDVVLSDMAPSFSGLKAIDRLRTVELAESALGFALTMLRPGGHFACKILQGPEGNELRARMKTIFEQVVYEKPKSSRSESAEGFLVGKGFRLPGDPPSDPDVEK
ncbi:ribosomal RNA methyltransferase FtsJ domain-containing protein [Blastocladiella britannica]|nr:ribosomal RNA methyltransferase FtsJ domain-containing protein [Blastocladiella britannica]